VAARAIALLVLAGCASPADRSAPATPASESPVPAAQVTVVPDSSERIYYYPTDGPLAAYHPDDRGPFLIEVRGRLTEPEQKRLRDVGVEVARLEMFTENTFVVRLGSAQRQQVEELPFVWEVRILQPDDKLDPTQFTGDSGQVEVIIDVLDVSEKKLAALGKLLESWDAEVRYAGGNTLRVATRMARLDAITRISDVIWIEPNR